MTAIWRQTASVRFTRLVDDFFQTGSSCRRIRRAWACRRHDAGAAPQRRIGGRQAWAPGSHPPARRHRNPAKASPASSEKAQFGAESRSMFQVARVDEGVSRVAGDGDAPAGQRQRVGQGRHVGKRQAPEGRPQHRPPARVGQTVEPGFGSPISPAWSRPRWRSGRLSPLSAGARPAMPGGRLARTMSQRGRGWRPVESQHAGKGRPGR